MIFIVCGGKVSSAVIIHIKSIFAFYYKLLGIRRTSTVRFMSSSQSSPLGQLHQSCNFGEGNYIFLSAAKLLNAHRSCSQIQETDRHRLVVA